VEARRALTVVPTPNNLISLKDRWEKSGASEVDIPPKGTARRGRLRLMLLLPALRKELEDLNILKQPLASLFEAYEDASVTLERLRREGRLEEAHLTSEYETICLEIEEDVIRYFASRLSSEPR
jgi:hypothetical protein